MRRFLGLVRADATSGLPLVFGALAVVANVLLIGTLPADMMSPGWGDRLNVLLTVSLYVTVLATGGAVAQAGLLVRRGIVDLSVTTPRGRWAPVRISAAASACWVVAAQTVGLMVVVLRGTAGPSSPWSWLLAGSAFGMPLAGSLLGSVLGSRLPGVAWAPVLAVLPGAWLYGWSYAPAELRKLSAVFPEVFYTSSVVEPNRGLVAGQLAVALSLGILAVAVLSTRGRRALLAGLGVVLAGGGLTSAVLASPDLTQYSREPHPACRSKSGTTLCVFRAYEPQLDGSLASLTLHRAAVAPFLDTPSRYHQDGLPLPGATYLGLYATGASDLSFRTIRAILPSPVCPADPTASGAAVDLSRWAAARAGSPEPLVEQPDFTSWDEATTRRWVDQQLALLRRPC